MQIKLSTVFQVLVLVAQDILAFEAKENASNPIQTLPSEPPATNSQTPVQ
ncbi:MAG: hypothetical protein V7L27_19470 [Nostoc sp.]